MTCLLTLGIGIYKLSDSLQKGRITSKIASMQGGLDSRLNIYENTIEMVSKNPVGVGVNSFEYFHPKYAYPGTQQASSYVNERQILRTPHNIVLKVYSELGLFGGTL